MILVKETHNFGESPMVILSRPSMYPAISIPNQHWLLREKKLQNIPAGAKVDIAISEAIMFSD